MHSSGNGSRRYASQTRQYYRFKFIDPARDLWDNRTTLGIAQRGGSLPQYFIPVGEVVKQDPKSEGINTPRKKKPKELAVITECCTGCAGSPACVPYCPVEDCMYWVTDEDHPPFGRIEVDPYLCIGCKKCVSKGPDGCFLDGCPWDAIEMIPIEDVESTLDVKFQI
jgi:ferredoxin